MTTISVHLVLVLFLLALALQGASLACKTVEELDNCTYEMSYLENRNFQIPTNDAEVLAMCARTRKGFKCLKDEAIDCMKGPMKSITIKILNTWEKHFNTRCNSPLNRTDFLKHVQCFTDPAKAEAVRLCSDKHMIMMEKVSNLPKELTLGGSCCAGNAMRDCVLEKIRSQCNGESGNYFNDMIQEVTEEKHQLMCADYQNMEQCNAKYDAATWKELKSISDSNDVSALKNHQYKTMIPIIMKMLKASDK